MLVKVVDVDNSTTHKVSTVFVREGSNVYEIPAKVISRQLRFGVYLVDDSYLNYETLRYTWRYNSREE